jgi:hypothetical protein
MLDAAIFKKHVLRIGMNLIPQPLQVLLSALWLGAFSGGTSAV